MAKTKKATKSTKSIHREVVPGRTQFWASMVENNGKYAIVTTNLPTDQQWLDKEGSPTEWTPEKAGELTKVLVGKQTQGAERVGVGLQAVRVYAQEKGYNMFVAKCVITQNEEGDTKIIVVLHKVEPIKKSNTYVFDLTRVAALEGGFPEGTIASDIAKEQLAAYGIELPNFIGTPIKLTATNKKQQNSAAERLKNNLNNLGLLFDQK